MTDAKRAYEAMLATDSKDATGKKENASIPVDSERLHRSDLKEKVIALFVQGTAPEDLLPYPTDQAAAELANILGVKDKLARKAVVDARISGRIPGFPPQAYLYVMFHKPPAAVCTRTEQNRFAGTRPTIYDVLPPGVPALPHVGRLDNDTSGLLLLTDDGQLAARLLQKVAPNKETLGSASVDDAQTLEVETPAATSKPPDAVDEYAHSPSCSRIKREEELSGVSKEYLVDVLPGKGVKFMHGGRINVKEALESMSSPLSYHKRGQSRSTRSASVHTVKDSQKGQHQEGGIEELSLEEVDGGLLDGMGAQPEDDAAVRLKVVICEGKNRQIRKLCARAGLIVQRLHRIRFGPLHLGHLAEGAARSLTAAEVRECYQETLLWDGRMDSETTIPQVLAIPQLH